MYSLWVNESLLLSLTSSLKVEFDPLVIETVSWYSLILLEFWTWPNHKTGVTLQWKVFVEKANKLVFVYLQRTVILGISSLLKRLKTHLVKNHFLWEWMYVITFQHWFDWIHFINISNCVSNMKHYILICSISMNKQINILIPNRENCFLCG